MSINHHFFGKDCLIDRELKNRDNLKENLAKKAFNGRDVLFLNQIHSNKVIVIEKKEQIYGDQNLPKADSLVTNISCLTIGVVTADCSPILLSDYKNKVIAAIHAGWRGAKSGVIKEAIVQMKNLGAKDISAIIGPMILKESYEVSQEFFDEFLMEGLVNKKFFEKKKEEGKYWFDLNCYVEEKLNKAGVDEVKNLKSDTYKQEEKFFSYRRSTHKKENDSGRNISVIEIGE